LAQSPTIDEARCYASADESTGGSPDALVSIDRTTGLNTVFIGLTGTNEIESLASIPGDHRLYAMDGAQLVSLNPGTGAATAIGAASTLSGNGSTGAVVIDDVDGLTYDLTEKIFYGAVRLATNDLLVKINPSTGELVPFANGDTYKVVTAPDSPHPAYQDLDDIAINPVDDALYGIWNDSAEGDLVIIDKMTAVAKTVAAFSARDMEGLSFFNDGQLYASSGANGSGDSNVLYRVDKTTNTVTMLGSLAVNGAGDFEGLACLTASAFIGLEKLTNGVDADLVPGPEIAAGQPVTWSFIIRNTGAVTIENVTLTDDQLPAGSIQCPAFPQPNNGLAPSEGITCTAAGIAKTGQYTNVASISGEGVPPLGARLPLSDTDPSHYFGAGVAAILELKKFTNGFDADQPPGPQVVVGQPVTWSFVITNSGSVTVENVVLSDNKLPAASLKCPAFPRPNNGLSPGEAIICTATGVAQAGQYANVATVNAEGVPAAGARIPSSDSDPSHYFGLAATLELKKLVNGLDADQPPGAQIVVGQPVTWSFIISNSGGITVSNIVLSDSKLPSASLKCPAFPRPNNSLAPGEAITCTATGVAQAGQYTNVAAVSGEGIPPTGARLPLSDSDPGHYLGVTAALDVKKFVNGVDADQPPGPQITVGQAVNWSFVISNSGAITVENITLTDNKLPAGAVQCPAFPRPNNGLAPGEKITCTAASTAQLGLMVNSATVNGVGVPPGGAQITLSDTDPAHYTGNAAPTALAEEEEPNATQHSLFLPMLLR
jgi:uncharacterized repeat protein (TIGR01451 family)